MGVDSNPELDSDMDVADDLLENIVPNTRFSKAFISDFFADLYSLISNEDSTQIGIESLSERLEILFEIIENENVLIYIQDSYLDYLYYFILRVALLDHKPTVDFVVKLIRNIIHLDCGALPYSSEIVRMCFFICPRMDTSLLKFAFDIFYAYVSKSRCLDEIVVGFCDSSLVEVIHFILYNSLSNDLLCILLLLLGQLLKISPEICNSYGEILCFLPSDVYFIDVSVTCSFAVCLVELEKHGSCISTDLLESVYFDLLSKPVSEQNSELSDLYNYAVMGLKERLCKSEIDTTNTNLEHESEIK